MNNKKILSIIVPIFNGEKSIEKLVLSLENQKYKNYDLILVNDGSTDNTLKIISELKNKYKNITIINKKNTGVGDSRNKGIDITKTKYITFADCDDYYSEDFFEKLIPIIDKKDFDILCFNYYLEDYANKRTTQLLNFKSETLNISKHDGIKKYLTGEFFNKFSRAPWNKIYLASIIKDNNFKYYIDKKRGEDLLFNILYFTKVKKIVTLDYHLYIYNHSFNAFAKSKYASYHMEETKKYIKYVKLISEQDKFKNYDKYLSIFLYRSLYSIVINETNNSNYIIGLNNLKKFFNDNEVKKSLKKIIIKESDFKIILSLILYKLRIYYLCYLLLYMIKKIIWRKKYEKNI